MLYTVIVARVYFSCKSDVGATVMFVQTVTLMQRECWCNSSSGVVAILKIDFNSDLVGATLKLAQR